MTQPAVIQSDSLNMVSSSSAIHSFLRFLWLLNRRKPVVLACMAGSVGLGILYYSTANRVYQAKAQVLVRHSVSDKNSVSLSSDRTTQDQMATFQRLFTSTEILSGALDRQQELPPEIDADDTREAAIETIRELVSAHTLRGTSIVELDGRSQEPKAAYALVDAVVASYINYIDQNHRSEAAEVLRILTEDKTKLERELNQKEQELLVARQRSSDLGISSGNNNNVVHPVLQNVIQLGQDINEVRKRRVRAEASLRALTQTVRSGGDLRQHLSSLEPLIGKELLLDSMGINPQQSQFVQEAEKDLVQLRARQTALSQQLGPNHFRMQEIQGKIDAINEQLSNFNLQIQQRMDGAQHHKLATMLTNWLQEELARSWQHEQELRREYAAAEQQATEFANQRASVDQIQREVDRMRESWEALLTRIENIDMSQHYADVRASLVSPPVLPRRPISPVLLRVLAMCMALGAGAGAAAVYLMDVIDDRFRSPEELQEQLSVPVMAMIRKHDMIDGHGLETLQVHRSPDDVASEAFRTLRTTLAFSGQDCSRIVITSSEPSDGKTTVLANLGVSYAQAGKRTLLIDCDLRRPGLTTLFEKRPLEGVSEVLRGKQDVGAMCRDRTQSTGLDGMDLLPAGRRPADSAELLSRERFMDMIAWAESQYDQILIDSPPVLAAADAAIAARQVDGVLVVVQPQKNHRRLVLRAFEGLASLGVNVLGTIVNAVGDDDSSGYYGYGGYGYGYGYGYGEGYGNDVEDESAGADRDAPEPSFEAPSRSRSHRSSDSRPPATPTHGDIADAEFQASLDRISKFKRKAA